MDQVSDALRTKHYSYRTEQTYLDWIKRYILFHQKRHPKDMGAEEIRAYRGTLTEPGRDSPYRNRSVEENLDLFQRMRAGDRKGALALYDALPAADRGMLDVLGYPTLDALMDAVVPEDIRRRRISIFAAPCAGAPSAIFSGCRAAKRSTRR